MGWPVPWVFETFAESLYHVHEGESDEDVAMDVDMEFVGEISRLTIRY
jgi:hypothetical protein